jgi:ATP synthase protein I
MSEQRKVDDQTSTALSREIGAQAKRKLKAQSPSGESVWFGLGMTGLIGWSVTVPTLLGAAFGIWLDKHHPGIHSWTLTMLITGLTIGCLAAWHWVAMEQKAMQDDEGEKSE